MNFNRIFVLGAGGIGSICGALLSEKYNVTLIGNKAHMDAINANGLSIVGDVKKTFHPEVMVEIGRIPEKSLVLLTTKAYDSARAISGIRKLLKKDTIILILQNGVGNENVVKQIVPRETKVLRGITNMAAEFLKPGKVRFWRGKTTIESGGDSAKIAGVFNESGLETKLSDNFPTDVWTKLVINCVVNPLSAILEVKNCMIFVDSLKKVRQSIVKECVDVGAAEGVILPRNLADAIDKLAASYTNISSMYQDLLKGKRTEVDFLNGKIVELGHRNHVKTPVNETIVGFIKFLERENGISRND
ncbi:MAG TPA: 2-dehydropantoate 2-reductase [Candidatus Acidoferrum sp.]|nr:2-dehydropantoate 2-reductase [Candidatus Acidoferrum sp.]